MLNADWVESYTELKIPVVGPDNANFMYIFNGIAVFRFKGNSNEWLRDTLRVRMPTKYIINNHNFLNFTANCALNSISNENSAINAGWASDKIIAKVENDDSGNKNVYAYIDLAVRDIDGFLYRVSFQVFALVEEGVTE